MKSKKSREVRRVLFLSLLALVVLTAAGCENHDVVSTQVGDGVLLDHGPGSYYPRYRVSATPCAASSGRPCSRVLTGLPRVDYSVRAVLEGNTTELQNEGQRSRIWGVLEERSVSLGVEILDLSDRGSIASFSGLLTQTWILSRVGDEEYFRAPELEDIGLPGGVRVVITTSWHGSPAPLDLSVTLQLVGGGTRL